VTPMLLKVDRYRLCSPNSYLDRHFLNPQTVSGYPKMKMTFCYPG
jgi:hypothetical protein